MRRTALVVATLGAVAAGFAVRHPAAPAAALALLALLAATAAPDALRAALRPRILLGAAAAAAVAAVLVATSDGLGRGLASGAGAFLRLGVLVAAGVVLRPAVSSDAVTRAAARVGLRRVALVLGLALNVVPLLAGAARRVWLAHRVRRPSRLRRLAAAPAVAEVLLAHTARLADEAAGAAALRGHAALTRPAPLHAHAGARLVVLTGPRGAGKTTTAAAVAAALAAGGRRVVGIVQPATGEPGHGRSFRVRDLATGGEAPLARPGAGAGAGYEFDAGGLALARRALGRARAGDVVVVDELGPLELRGGGHLPAVRRALARVGPGAALLVVRRSLVPSLLALLGAEGATVVDLETCGDEAVPVLLQAIAGERTTGVR